MREMRIIGMLVFTMFVLFGLSDSVCAQEIKIGGIMDTPGATSDVGKDYAIGMEDAFKYINENGGVNGKPIKYTWFDYGYRITAGITKYKLLKRFGAFV